MIWHLECGRDFEVNRNCKQLPFLTNVPQRIWKEGTAERRMLLCIGHTSVAQHEWMVVCDPRKCGIFPLWNTEKWSGVICGTFRTWFSVNCPLTTFRQIPMPIMVTGQLADTPTLGLPTRELDDLRTGHLADWSTRGLDNSRTGQVTDWTTRGCHRRLCVLSFPFWRYLWDRELSSPRLVQSASWLVCELSSPRVDQSARCPVRELAIRELAYPRVVQLPPQPHPFWYHLIYMDTTRNFRMWSWFV